MADHQDPLDDRDMDLLEEMGYEPTDTASESPVGRYTLWFFGFLAVMMGVSFLFLTVADRVQGFKFTQQRTERRVLPPEGTPLLQSNITAHGDMKDLRKLEVEKLNAMGWTDEMKDTAKIPVDRAMRILAERGLPTRAEAGVPGDYQKMGGSQ